MSSIAFTDKGSGIPVILVHGFCESKNLWEEMSVNLSNHCRILCPDLPGFGNSPFPEKEEFKLEDIAEILKSWLDSLSIESCVMIGHSLGGYVTLAFADLYPETLMGFGLFHSTCQADAEDKKNTRNKVVLFISEHSANEFTDTFIPGLFYNKTEQVKHHIERLVLDARSCTKKSLISYTKAMRDRPDRCFLMKMDIPILFIAGEEDSAVPIQFSRQQTMSLDPRFVHFLPETGHMGMFERKEETTSMLIGFLKEFNR